MNALLVLCNLHADGPSTWRQLRSHGIAHPAELAGVPIDRLAEWLGGSPSTARRFVREAERATREAPFEAAANTKAPDAPARPWPVHESGSRDVPSPPEARANVRAFPLDELAPRSALPSQKVAPAEFAHPRRATRTSADGLLRPGCVAGLDLAACQKLVGAGVRTWDDLARIPAARIAAVTSLAEDDLRAWQVGSRRDRTPSAPSTERVVELRPFARGAPPRTSWSPEPLALVQREIEDAAGPFA